MRDFRDAKSMARTIRAALGAKGVKITNSESLELISQAFGLADWNTLSAHIRKERLRVAPEGAPLPAAEGVPVLPFSFELAAAMRRGIGYASRRHHEYATLEHLSLALLDDPDASRVMRACTADLAALKGKLANYIDSDLKRLVVDGGEEAKPTPAFHRVVQGAGLQAWGSGRSTVTDAASRCPIGEDIAFPAHVWRRERAVIASRTPGTKCPGGSNPERRADCIQGRRKTAPRFWIESPAARDDGKCLGAFSSSILQCRQPIHRLPFHVINSAEGEAIQDRAPHAM